MIQSVAPERLAEWAAQCQQQGLSPLLLDVREAWELQTASIQPPGLDFVHVPMQLIPASLDQLPPSRAIAVLCHHGVRSMHVARFLQSQGYEHLANLTGGIHAWSERVDPQVAVY